MAQIQERTGLMSQLLAQTNSIALPNVGETVQGDVISAAKNEVCIDINGLVVGVVRGPELFDESGDFSNLKVGDAVTATVLELENENGELELSFRQAGHKKAWEKLEHLQGANEIVDAQIMDANKGGLIVRVGHVSGFLPVSQLSVEHYPRVEGGNKAKILERLQTYVTQHFRVKVIDVDEVDEKLIVSEKMAKAEQQQEKIAQYKVGDSIAGKVTGVVDFGAFVEFGDNLEGLVHISEIAWQRIDDPKEYLKVGDDVKAQIIAIDNGKISLSIRNLIADPWLEVAARYKIGEVVRGKVLKLNPFGAFVELDSDIHGLAHISELSYRKLNAPSEILKIGDVYDFKIISIEPGKHRLGLSYKSLHEQKPEEKPEEKSEEKEEKTVEQVAS
ncbi:MAG: RNA binding S1 protein [uncultured bacterium]|nr:MAG: RNA binding S1 protein [uncultured bacterium]HBY73633.1 30S ribosomal protein S1 [Candidatus Kerfeldbacteria bacterium]